MIETIVMYGIIIIAMIYIYVNHEIEKDNDHIKRSRKYMFAK
jgi:hypothetical protein